MKKLMAVIVFLVLFFGVWDVAWRAAGVRQVFPWELERMLREEPEKLVLLDVRTPFEYGLFHIPGAVNRPFSKELLANPQTPKGDSADRKIVLICMTGHRSPVAVWKLEDETEGELYNLTWGMLGWLAAFGPVE